MASYNELRRKVQGGPDNVQPVTASNMTSKIDKTETAEKVSPAEQIKQRVTRNAERVRKERGPNADMFANKSDAMVALMLYVKIAGLVCELDVNIMEYNQSLIKTMKDEDDRYVPIESLLFLANNIGYIVCMLSLDYRNIKDWIADALNAEILTDDMSSSAKKAFRDQTMDSTLRNSKNLVKMGLTMPDSDTLAKLCEMAQKNVTYMSQATRVMSEIDKVNARKSKDDFMTYSIILSNHIYLLRVFSKNGMLLDRISDMIDSFKMDYGLQ